MAENHWKPLFSSAASQYQHCVLFTECSVCVCVCACIDVRVVAREKSPPISRRGRKCSPKCVKITVQGTQNMYGKQELSLLVLHSSVKVFPYIYSILPHMSLKVTWDPLLGKISKPKVIGSFLARPSAVKRPAGGDQGTQHTFLKTHCFFPLVTICAA